MDGNFMSACGGLTVDRLQRTGQILHGRRGVILIDQMCTMHQIGSRLIRTGEYRDRKPRVLTYGLSADEAHRFGLPCGGTLQLQFVLEPVCAQSRLPELQVLQRQELVVTRTLNLDTGVVSPTPGAQVSTLRFDGQCLTAVMARATA